MAFDSNIDIFRAKLKNASRPNRFKISFLDVISNEDLTFFVKSASIPSKTVGPIEVDWQGMKVKLAGDLTFADWTCTFINDQEYTVRNTMENWHDLVGNALTNTRGSVDVYKYPIKIEHLDGMNNVTATYFLIGAFPTEVGEISLEQGANDTVEEFPVTFSFDYFTRDSI